jgi:hypothetical protein
MEATLFFVIAIAAAIFGLWRHQRRLTLLIEEDGSVAGGTEDAALRDRAFLRLCDEVAAQGKLARIKDPKGWVLQLFRKDFGDSGLIEVELQHADEVKGSDHRLRVRVSGLTPKRLHLQSRDAVAFEGVSQHRPRRAEEASMPKPDDIGDAAFDDALRLYDASAESLAALNAGARGLLVSLAGAADVHVRGGALSAKRRLSRIHGTAQDVLDFVEAVYGCARCLQADTSSQGLAAAWVATLRGDPCVEVRVRLLETLRAAAPHGQALQGACAALCEDPSEDMRVRVGAATLCGAQGWPLLEQTAANAEADEALRVSALRALWESLPDERAHPLMVALLNQLFDRAEGEPPQVRDLTLLDAAIDLLSERPCPGALGVLEVLLHIRRNTFKGADRALGAILSAISAQPEQGAVEAALLTLLHRLVDEPFSAVLRGLRERGGLATVLALKQMLRRDDIDDTERGLMQDVVGVIQAKLSDGQDTGGALSLFEGARADGALSLVAGADPSSSGALSLKGEDAAS